MFYFILTLMLLPLKLLFICTLARSLGVSISNNSSAVQLNKIHSFFNVSTSGLDLFFSQSETVSCETCKKSPNCC